MGHFARGCELVHFCWMVVSADKSRFQVNNFRRKKYFEKKYCNNFSQCYNVGTTYKYKGVANHEIKRANRSLTT